MACGATTLIGPSSCAHSRANVIRPMASSREIQENAALALPNANPPQVR
jgi:hypothetical protein